MSEFNVGGVTATVEPDFDKFTPALKRGLERAERGASFRIELFPELKRGWAAKMRADLQKSSAKFSIPADLSVSKSAIAQMKKAVKAHGPVTVGVTVDASQVAKEQAKASKAAARTSAAVILKAEFDTQQIARAANSASRGVGRIANPVKLRAEIDAGQVAREANTAIRGARNLIGDINVGVDVDAAQVAAKLKAAAAAANIGDIDIDAGRMSSAGSASGSAFAGGFKKAIGGGALVGSAVVAGSGAAFVGVTKAAADFESQLSELNAVSSATEAQMKLLSDAALKAGADTTFSAQEAAEAQTELAKAGLTVEQIMGGALAGTLSLAAAGGLDLADAATVSANALNAFKLSGDQTTHVADLLAAAANKSAADVSELAPALQQSALVAAQMGLTLEETTGGLAAFAQAGLKGSDAGTSFKTFLQRLVPQTEEASKAMEAMGLSFFDNNGKFVGLTETAGRLRTALSGMTDEQRNSTLQTLFGSDAIRAAAVIYDEGAAGVGKWISAVDDAGFASEVATKKLDNLKGDLEALKGSIETVAIGAGSGASSGLRTLVQDLTGFVNQAGPLLMNILTPFSGLISVLLPQLVPLLEPLSGVIGSITAAFGDVLVAVMPIVAEGVGVVADLFDELGPAFTTTLDALQPVFDLLGELFAMGAGVFGDLISVLLPTLATILGDVAIAMGPLLDALGPALSDILAALLPVISELGAEFGEAFVAALIAVTPLLVEIAGVLPELITGASKLVIPIVDLVTALLEMKPVVAAVTVALAGFVAYKGAMLAIGVATKAWAAAQTLVNIAMSANPVGLIIAGIAALAAGIVVAYKKFKPFRDLVDNVGRFMRDTLWPAIKNVAGVVGGALVSAFQTVWPIIKKVWDLFYSLQIGPIVGGIKALVALFTGDFSGALDAVKGVFSGIGEAFAGVGEMLGGVLSSIGSWITDTAVPFLVEKVPEWIGALFGWLRDAVPTALLWLGNILVSIGQWIVGTAVPWLVEQGASMLYAFVGWILNAAISLPLQLAEWLASFAGWLVLTAIPWLLQKGSELLTAFTGWITDLVVGFPDRMMGWLTAFATWLTGTAIPWVKEKAGQLVGAITSWVTDAITALPSQLAGIATAVTTFLTSLPAKVAESAKSVGSAIWNGIVSGITGAASFVGDVASKIWNGLKNLINDNLITPIREFEVLGGHPLGSFPYLAEGAVITKPTVAMVGEAGPELVLPLSNPARMAALIGEATSAGLMPASTPLTATSAPVAAATSAATAAAGPSLTTENVQLWATEITEIMVALPMSVTEQTLPLWTDWVAQLEAIMAGWSQRFVTGQQQMWFTAETTQRDALARMVTSLGNAITTMVSTASTGASRIGTALNDGLNAAINTAVLKVQDYGTKLAGAINPVLAAIGQPPVTLKFAEGGHVPGPRVRADVVPAMLMPGEFVIKRDVVDRVGVNRLRALNDGQVQHFAEGGSVLPADSVARAQAFARAQNGEPYVWGSSGPDGFDCSGFWSAIINTIREPGSNPYRRLFNTASLIDGGWRNVGLLPGLGQVSVGAFKGDPGHMAGTIAGLNAESRGSAGVVVGPGARGATSSLFTNRYHMGNGLYLGENGTLFELPEPYKLGSGIINMTGEKYMQYLYGKTKPWVDKNTYTSNVTAGMLATEPGVALASGWLPATSGKISEFGGPGDVNKLAVTGGLTSNPPLGPYYAAMRWQTRNYSALRNNRLKATLARTGRSVVMYPGDWGPAQWTGRVLDISPAAMSALGGRTDDVVSISSVASGSRTGPVPVLHDGGEYTNSWGGEGLALLEHGERVLPRDPVRAEQVYREGYGSPDRSMEAAFNELAAAMRKPREEVTVNVQAPEGTTDPHQFGTTVGLRVRNARR
jgi:TP901 family phage tail tape measure protein